MTRAKLPRQETSVSDVIVLVRSHLTDQGHLALLDEASGCAFTNHPRRGGWSSKRPRGARIAGGNLAGHAGDAIHLVLIAAPCYEVIMGSMEIVDQASFLVRKEGRDSLGIRYEYRISGTRHSFVSILRPVQALFPRSKIGLGLADAAYDVEKEDVRGWLEKRGYELKGWLE